MQFKRIKLFILVVQALLISSKAFSTDLNMLGQQTRNLGQHETWLALLHYSNGSSLIKDPNFFLSSIGEDDPAAELIATIATFYDDPQIICKYPARFSWLQTMGVLDTGVFKSTACPELEAFKENVSAKKLFLVFATEKVSKPTSAMGHMFF